MSTILIAHIRSTHTIFDKINSFLFQKIKFFSFVKCTTVIVESAEPSGLSSKLMIVEMILEES